MSRHLLVDRPDFQLVVGFDHRLRSFFGQVFDPSCDLGIAVGGWPTRSGLGTRRPADTLAQGDEDFALLEAWAWAHLSPREQADGSAQQHFGAVFGALAREWSAGEDADARPVPDFLRGPRS